MPTVQCAYGPRLSDVELFRFFETEAYASDFLNGRVWITTLSSCRRAEGSERGDRTEAAFTHHIERMTRSENPRQFDAAMAQTGVFTNVEGDLTLQNISIIGGEPDMYMLCLTQLFDPKAMEGGFGKWAVRVAQPKEFFRLLTKAVAELTGIDQAAMGPVEYLGREMADYQAAKVPKFFLKPKDGYAHQKEVRMLWNKANQVWLPKPFLLPCPEVAALCSLVGRGGTGR